MGTLIDLIFGLVDFLTLQGKKDLSFLEGKFGTAHTDFADRKENKIDSKVYSAIDDQFKASRPDPLTKGTRIKVSAVVDQWIYIEVASKD